MQRLIKVRKKYKAFGRGSLWFLHPDNLKVMPYIRQYEGETILCVVNLSRFAQPAELDLRDFAGYRPVELIGETPFPEIGELPYFITLGPHAFLWFRLEPPAAEGE